MSFVVAKDADWDVAFIKKNMTGRSCHGGTVLCCVAGCDTNCMDKFFLCPHLKYSMWDRGGAGPLTGRIPDTQVPPALSHFISPGIHFTEHPLFSNSNRPDDFNTLLCTELGSFYKRMGWYSLTYPHPASHQGYVEALSHMVANLRLQISYQILSAALWSYTLPHLLHLSHSLVASTHHWEGPGGNMMAQKLCIYIWQVSKSRSKCEECKVIGLSLSATAALRGVSLPVQLGGMLLHQVKCWAPGVWAFIITAFLGQAIKACGLCPNLYGDRK